MIEWLECHDRCFEILSQFEHTDMRFILLCWLFGVPDENRDLLMEMWTSKLLHFTVPQSQIGANQSFGVHYYCYNPRGKPYCFIWFEDTKGFVPLNDSRLTLQFIRSSQPQVVPLKCQSSLRPSTSWGTRRPLTFQATSSGYGLTSSICHRRFRY